MRLRRIIEHVKSESWFAVGLDFIIVVLGVFMGLQVQEWKQQRIDRDQERAYLERLSSDFAAIDAHLQTALDVYADSTKAIAAVSQVVKNQAEAKQSPPPDQEVFAQTLIRLSADAFPAGRSATFVEMLSSGDLSLLRDETLRNVLIAYDQHTQVTWEAWRSLRGEAGAYTRPLYENIELQINLKDASFAEIRTYDLEAMANNRDFHTMLNMLAGSRGSNYELFQRQRDHADAVRLLMSDKDRPD